MYHQRSARSEAQKMNKRVLASCIGCLYLYDHATVREYGMGMGFEWDKHAGFFHRSLLNPGLPRQYTTADTQRTTLAYFCVTGLDLLGKLDSSCTEADRTAVKRWVLAQQVAGGDWRQRGFRGGSFGVAAEPSQRIGKIDDADEGNLAATYSALATLVALDVDLTSMHTGVDSDAIVRALGSLQQEDGSFKASASDSTCDIRFTYCACAVSTILGNWSGVDRRKAAEYVERCYDFDGGIGMAPGREACAGPTYCAVASLKLLGVLEKLPIPRRQGLLEWCVNRQGTGFQGRPNKTEDSCCSFWVGATLALLDGLDLVDEAQARQFHVSCQNRTCGGFAKAPGVSPDLLHSFYSISWLSLAGETGVREMDAALGVTKRAAGRIRRNTAGGSSAKAMRSRENSNTPAH